MATFTTLRSRVVPLPMDDVDTDQIIPARFLKGVDKLGLGEQLFADWRYEPDGAPKPAFPLNAPDARGAEILLAGNNFGCGSSREHAPWALASFGFRAIVATSFADIFRNNALKNGLLPVVVDPPTAAWLFASRARDPKMTLTVDVEAQTLALPGGGTVAFPIDAFAKHCLVHGVDELGYLLSFLPQIEAFEAASAAGPASGART